MWNGETIRNLEYFLFPKTKHNAFEWFFFTKGVIFYYILFNLG